MRLSKALEKAKNESLMLGSSVDLINTTRVLKPALS